MLSRKILIIFFISFIFPQNALSGYGFGSSVDNSEAASLGVSNELLPSFKSKVSLSNPSTWHNLLFSYLNTSVNVQNSVFQSNSSTNFSLSSAKLIIPWKQKMAFGVSFEPFLNREVAISDSTFSSFSFNDEDILFSRINSSSGGPSKGQLSFGYKLNEMDSFGTSLNIIFGSSRSTRNLIVDNENHLLQSRDYFSGSMIDLFYSTSRIKIKEKPIFLSVAYSLPLNGIDIENDPNLDFFRPPLVPIQIRKLMGGTGGLIADFNNDGLADVIYTGLLHLNLLPECTYRVCSDQVQDDAKKIQPALYLSSSDGKLNYSPELVIDNRLNKGMVNGWPLLADYNNDKVLDIYIADQGVGRTGKITGYRDSYYLSQPNGTWLESVSYTHLTLPTILLV